MTTALYRLNIEFQLPNILAHARNSGYLNVKNVIFNVFLIVEELLASTIFKNLLY